MYNIPTVNYLNINNRLYPVSSQPTEKINSAAVTSPINETKTENKTQLLSLHKAGENQSFQNISFGINQIRTSLSGREEQEKYNAIASLIDKKQKKELHSLLKTGRLLDKSSNDNSTTLDNLYKIIQNERITGLDKKKIAEEVISTINNPFIITQKFGDIPLTLQNEIIKKEQEEGKNITSFDLDVKSSTCPAASIEFNLAHKMPAEFARMAESLTSDKIAVEKTIQVKDLSQNLMDTIWMLNEFGTEHKLLNWNTLKVTLRPDRNAIVRARVQNTYKDKDERSVIDVLMQSTFMNVGAQNTYDSLIDKRIPKYNEDDSGLIDIEKNFAEELATGKGKICVTYQKIDDEGKLIGYECEPEETLSHIQNTLNKGDNVIIGYTYCDNNNYIIGGHEITIIGIETDKAGNKYFVCNDTDDGVTGPIKYSVNELLPQIHHAGIPKSVLVGNVEFVEGWKELMQMYKTSKQNQELQTVSQNPLYVLNRPV